MKPRCTYLRVVAIVLHRDVGVLDRVLIIGLVEVDKGQIRRRVRNERLVLLLIALQHLDRLGSAGRRAAAASVRLVRRQRHPHGRH